MALSESFKTGVLCVIAEITMHRFFLLQKIKQHELGEMENHAVVTGKKRGRPQKSYESSCCTLGDSGKERGLSDREENRKELSPRIEELPYCGSRNMEEENHSSSGDKQVEEIPNDKVIICKATLS